MNVLVIGGTHFIGPHIVRALLDGDHRVTLFNRGRTPDDFGDDVERLIGDRLADHLEALVGRSFDATIDTCGYVPRAVHAVFDALDDPGFYCFVSTISVYASLAEHDQDESAPLAELDDPTTEDVGAGSYGGLKVLCEDVVRERAWACAILRLGLVVGPGDATDRFTYWVARTDDGGTMLAPGRPRSPMQWIDARDVADFGRLVVERSIDGTFNVATPARTMTLGALLATARIAASNDVRHCWISTEQVEDLELQPWIDFPAWLPEDGDSAGFATFDVSKALAAGLRNRAVEITVNDTLEWWRKQGEERRHLRTGLAREKEQEIVASVCDSQPIVSVRAAGAEGEVGRLLDRAFPTTAESQLVAAVRDEGVEAVEVLMWRGEALVGYVMFSALEEQPTGVASWALGPIAVDPDWQNRGLGTLLGEVGIEECRARGADVVFVLGDPEYYPRFGFDSVLASRVSSPYSDAGASWMALELTAQTIERIEWVRYPAPFEALS